MIKLLVIDDEAPARERMLRLLEGIEDVLVLGEAADGLEAARLLETLSPDLLLLDIEMPGMDGLTLAARGRGGVPVIFVTAHLEHAVRAFELRAVDYLLKPVRRPRLVQALERARLRLSEHMATPPPQRVVAHENGVAHFYDVASIDRFYASHKYTAFLSDGEEHLTEESLSALETRLAPMGFLRVHRAELVRLDAVISVSSRSLTLRGGVVVPVSKRLAMKVRQQLRP